MDTKVTFKYHIRRMKPKDIGHVAALEKHVFSDPWPRNAYVQEIYFNPIARYFVLETQQVASGSTWLPWKQRTKDEIRGFAGIRVESGKGHISTLAVHPTWRGYGFGEMLLITVLETAIRMGAQHVTLEVRVSNEVAKFLYRKYDFHVISQLSNYYKNREDAALMEVDVSTTDYERWLQEQREIVEARIARMQ
jgi:[ribosomal protein S18]-alanine N-acetyltransferase